MAESLSLMELTPQYIKEHLLEPRIAHWGPLGEDRDRQMIADYAAKMAAGEWDNSRSHIQITNGRLTDGWHRCMAICLLNRPFVLSVLRRDTIGGQVCSE